MKHRLSALVEVRYKARPAEVLTHELCSRLSEVEPEAITYLEPVALLDQITRDAMLSLPMSTGYATGLSEFVNLDANREYIFLPVTLGYNLARGALGTHGDARALSDFSVSPDEDARWIINASMSLVFETDFADDVWQALSATDAGRRTLELLRVHIDQSPIGSIEPRDLFVHVATILQAGVAFAVVEELVLRTVRQKNRDLSRLPQAQDPETSPDILAELALSKDTSVKQAVAANPSALPETLHALAASWHGDPGMGVQVAVAGNPSAPPEVLTGLHRDPNHDVRRAVAANPGTPDRTLVALACDYWGPVSNAVLRNPSATDFAKRAAEHQLSKKHDFDLPGLADGLLARAPGALEALEELARIDESALEFLGFFLEPEAREVVEQHAGRKLRRALKKRWPN